MPPVFSKLMDHKSIIEGIREQETAWSPPVPFKSKATFGKYNKSDGNDSADEDDTAGYITLEIKHDPDDKKSQKYKMKLYKFEKGNSEDWVLYRKQMDDLFVRLQIENESAKQYQHYVATLVGKAKDVFHEAFNTRTKRNDDLPCGDQRKRTATELLAYALNDTAKPFFENWKSSVRAEKNYLRTCLYIGNQNPKNVIERVKNINEGLKYYPIPDNKYPPKIMPEDDIIDCIDNAKKLEWHIIMMAQGRRPDSFETLAEAQEYYEQLYRADQMKKALEKPSKNTGNQSKKRKNARDETSEKKMKCKICGRTNHTTADHKSKEELQQQFKRHKSSSKYHKKESSETKMRNAMMAQMMEQAFAAGANSVKKANKKRKAKETTDSFMASLQEKMEETRIENEPSDESSVESGEVSSDDSATACSSNSEK